LFSERKDKITQGMIQVFREKIFHVVPSFDPNTHDSLKKVLVIIGISLLAIIIGLFAAAEIFEEKIGASFKESINKTLKSEFHFETFDLSLVRSFPYATIRFQDVLLLDSKEDTLLQADRAHFKLDVFSLLQSKIKVNATQIENGVINISVDKSGLANYDIISPSASTNESSTGLAIKEARILDMDINYTDASSRSNVHFKADDLLLGLDLADKVNITMLGTLQSKVIAIDKLKYLTNKTLSVNSGLTYDNKERALSFQNGEVGIEGIVFNTSGTIKYNGDHEIYNLVMTNTDGNLESIFKLLPDEQVDEFRKITSSGDFDLTVFYKGKQSKYTTPELQAELSYERGRIVIPQLDIPLKNVSFSAKYLDKSKKGLKDASILINGFKASLDGERITGSMVYNDFSNPHLKLNATGKMPIQTVLDITGIKADDIDGNLKFNKLIINGLIRDLSSPMHQSRTVSQADVDLDNITFTVDNKEVLLQDGRLVGEKDYFELKDLVVRTPKSVFQLNGYLKRLIPYLFAEFQRPDLQFDLDVKSATADIAELVDLANSQSVDQVQAKQVSNQSDSYIGAMNGDVTISMDKFKYEDIKGTDFNGHLTFFNNSILIKGGANGMGGTFDLEGMLTRKANRDQIEAKIVCNKIDVNTFFQQTHDFGQKTIRSKNLKGKLNSQLLIIGNWNIDGSFNRKGMHVYGNAQILNGELINLEMMENFSSFVNLEDLRHIKFGSLDNYFEIKNEVIHIPTMFIQSNAVNLTLNGEHAFNNAIDYNIKVNAGQVLTNKLKRHNPRLTPKPARKKGFFNLYYAVKGTAENPTYKTAKRQVKTDLENSESIKAQIKLKLDRAFPKQKQFTINTDPIDIEN